MQDKVTLMSRRLRQTVHFKTFRLEFRFPCAVLRIPVSHPMSVHHRRAVLNVYDAVVRAPPLAKLYVHFALNVHKDEAAGETDGDHDKLRPERPFEEPRPNFLSSPIDENVQRPYDAGYCDYVESHRTDDFPAFDFSHLELLPLAEWFDAGSHSKIEFTQFTRLCIRAFDPLLQTRLVNVLQSARTRARRYQRRVEIALALTYAARVHCHGDQRCVGISAISRLHCCFGNFTATDLLRVAWQITVIVLNARSRSKWN